jgi:hypothetical protein
MSLGFVALITPSPDTDPAMDVMKVCPAWYKFAAMRCPSWLGGSTCTQSIPNDEDSAAICQEWSANNYDNECYRQTVGLTSCFIWAEGCGGECLGRLAEIRRARLKYI